ncbi:MAG: ABC transporter ATP-binding protein [Bacteroidota bacterium]|nr:ABC transporter ATP-binding protein [Bacteroidota bacterium]
MQVTAEGVSKKFNRRPVFHQVSFTVEPGEVFGITGRNGSGKSTLLRILGGLMTPSAGKLLYHMNGSALDPELLYRHIGYVAPYLTLYEEFNAEENIALYARIRGLPLTRKEILAFLARVGLPTDRRDPIRSFSSGMKQRMKLLFGILHQPPLLLLDEPISNLDSSGMEIVYDIVREFRTRGTVIIATNDAEDIAQCDRTLTVEGRT